MSHIENPVDPPEGATPGVFAGWTREQITAYGRKLREQVADLPQPTVGAAPTVKPHRIPAARVCPECSQPVEAGRVRHPQCLREAHDQPRNAHPEDTEQP
jgi:hypothetical protein